MFREPNRKYKIGNMLILPVALLLIITTAAYVSHRDPVEPKNTAGSVINTPQKPSAAQTANFTFIECELVENYTAVIISGHLTFMINSDAPCRIDYILYGVNIKADRIITVHGTGINLKEGINYITIPLEFTVYALPGTYYYHVIITYYNSTNGGSEYPVVLYEKDMCKALLFMGHLWTYVILIITVSAVILIMMIELHVKKEPAPPPTVQPSQVYVPGVLPPPQQTTAQQQQQQQQPATRPGYIRCPECKKEIKEGSSFCPECGYHIPKFLRTRPA